MSTPVSWPLSKLHEIHYFTETPDISGLFANMSLFCLENQLEVVSVAFERRYDDDLREIVHSATMIYLPEGDDE